MSTAAEYDAAGPASAANCSPERTLIAIDWRCRLPVGPILRRSRPWLWLVSSSFPVPTKRFRTSPGLSVLRLQIERARSLSPDAREAIGRVTARTSTLAGFSDPSQEARRKAAIERITGAMKTKEVTARAGDPPAQQ